MTLRSNTTQKTRRSPLAVGVSAVLLLLWALGASAAAEARPSCAGKQATIVSNAPVIAGTKGHDVIVAGAGDNVIRGGGGNDTICAGPGDDTVYGERGNDDLYGGAGEDELIGDFGNDRLDGGAGDHDVLDGGPGDDSLAGGSGNSDVLTGGPGVDSIDGGPGAHDLVSYRETGGGLRIDLASGAVSGNERERLSGIEDALGGSADDTLIGSPGTANQLDGGAGNDRLEAAGDGDQAYGGPGSDECVGGFAAEDSCGPASASDAGMGVELYVSIDRSSALVLTGGRHSDRAMVSSGAGSYTVTGQAGGGAVIAGDGCRPGPNRDTVICGGAVSAVLAALGAGDDVLLLNPSVPAAVTATLDGGPGSDTLRGGPGDDTLYGGNDHDDDVLEGGGGDDVVFGINILHPRHDSGAARMLGGPGDDLLIGGQPCDGDYFEGGEGANDSASFARVRNSGVFVKATIGGPVTDPDVPGCEAGFLDSSVEKIEGSPGRDLLIGDGSPNVLMGRGGNDDLDGRGGFDRCIAGGGRDTLRNCELDSWGSARRGKAR